MYFNSDWRFLLWVLYLCKGLIAFYICTLLLKPFCIVLLNRAIQSLYFIFARCKPFTMHCISAQCYQLTVLYLCTVLPLHCIVSAMGCPVPTQYHCTVVLQHHCIASVANDLPGQARANPVLYIHHGFPAPNRPQQAWQDAMALCTWLKESWFLCSSVQCNCTSY